jgi:DNA-binding NarL/FixJ family response regulator
MRPIPVLFIDASPPFRQLVARLIERYFADDITLLDAIDRWPPDTLPSSSPRAVLLGLGAEGLADARLIAAIQATLPDVPVIVLGHLSDPAYRTVALAAGAADFVAKEALGDELIPLLRRIVAP